MAEKITQAEIDARAVSKMAIRPNDRSSYGAGGLSPSQVRARFDALALLVISRYNELVDELQGGAGGTELQTTVDRILADIASGELAAYMQVYGADGSLKSLQDVLFEIPTSGGDNAGGGSDGIGIASVVQTTTSTADGGANIITVTLTNGTKTQFTVRNGKQGSTGYTPQRGKDYWTPTDKSEMVNDVIAALPRYNGEVSDA